MPIHASISVSLVKPISISVSAPNPTSGFDVCPCYQHVTINHNLGPLPYDVLSRRSSSDRSRPKHRPRLHNRVWAGFIRRMGTATSLGKDWHARASSRDGDPFRASRAKAHWHLAASALANAAADWRSLSGGRVNIAFSTIRNADSSYFDTSAC
jgi:hypothetical protein